MARSATTDAIGFFMGFFLGCCGLFVAATLFREHFRGAVIGVGANMLLGIVVGVATEMPSSTSIPVISPDGSPLGADVPWDIVLAVGIAGVTLLVIVAAGIWLLGGSKDDDDDPPEPPDNHQYVSFN